MEQCPQCQSERIQGENFCDNCGHKYTDPAQSEPEAPSIDTQEESHEVEENVNAGGSSAGAIYIQSGSGELPIYFEENPKAIGRNDVSEFLKSQNVDPLQISRKQCTIFKNGEEYYVEDGVTTVQDKPSGNHTTVNGKDITGQGKVKLNNDDKIEFATVARAVFRIG